MTKKNNLLGFTLIEMIIVLAVIAAIIAIAIPSVKGMRQEAKISECQGELRTLQTATEHYYRRNDTYPPNVDTAIILTTPNIITKVLDDPFKTSPNVNGQGVDGYGYSDDPDADGDLRNWYVIYSWGPDKTQNWTWSVTNSVHVNNSDDIVISNALVD